MKKPITILNTNFMYEVECYVDNDILSSFETSFYIQTNIKQQRKWWLFGPIVEVPIYNYCFHINNDIENPRLDRSNLKETLENMAQEYLDIEKRRLEILNGEII